METGKESMKWRERGCCDLGEGWFLAMRGRGTYLLHYLLTYLLTYLHSYLLTYWTTSNHVTHRPMPTGSCRVSYASLIDIVGGFFSTSAFHASRMSFNSRTCHMESNDTEALTISTQSEWVELFSSTSANDRRRRRRFRTDSSVHCVGAHPHSQHFEPARVKPN